MNRNTPNWHRAALISLIASTSALSLPVKAAGNELIASVMVSDVARAQAADMERWTAKQSAPKNNVGPVGPADHSSAQARRAVRHAVMINRRRSAGARLK